MAVRTAVVVLDLLVFILPAVAGMVSSRYQSGGEAPTERMRQFGYAAVLTMALVVLLHVLMLASVLPRVPLASFYLPLGFSLGYTVHRILVAGVRPSYQEGVVLAGMSISGGLIVSVWIVVRTLVT